MHVTKGKTLAQSISDRTDYGLNPEKTNDGELTSAYACDPRSFASEVLVSKRQYRVDWQFKNRLQSGYATYIEIEYEPEPEFRITEARMREIADQVRRITGTADDLTPAKIVEMLEFVPATTTVEENT